MKRILSTLAALAVVVGSALPAAADRLDDIRAAGVVRIGVSLGGEPIGFRDAQNNPVGYDVDVATMLAEKLGVPVEFTDVSGDARISMLVSGQLDIVVANTSATLERAKSVDFTIPYNRAGLRVIVQADSGIASLEDLAGKSVVVGRGTTGEAFIKEAVPGGRARLCRPVRARRRAAAAAGPRRRRHRGFVAPRLPRHAEPVARDAARASIPTIRSASPWPRAIRNWSAGSTCSCPTTSSRAPTRRTTRNGGARAPTRPS